LFWWHQTLEFDVNDSVSPKRIAVQQLHEAINPKFAVFMRSESGRSAWFKYLHDSLDSAIDTCREFASNAARDGSQDFTYYAVEIKHRVGIEHGKLVDQSMK
jgi:hypothetical protein